MSHLTLGAAGAASDASSAAAGSAAAADARSIDTPARDAATTPLEGRLVWISGDGNHCGWRCVSASRGHGTEAFAGSVAAAIASLQRLSFAQLTAAAPLLMVESHEASPLVQLMLRNIPDSGPWTMNQLITLLNGFVSPDGHFGSGILLTAGGLALASLLTNVEYRIVQLHNHTVHHCSAHTFGIPDVPPPTHCMYLLSCSYTLPRTRLPAHYAWNHYNMFELRDPATGVWSCRVPMTDVHRVDVGLLQRLAASHDVKPLQPFTTSTVQGDYTASISYHAQRQARDAGGSTRSTAARASQAPDEKQSQLTSTLGQLQCCAQPRCCRYY